MSAKTMQIVLIDEKKSALMQAADMFEKWKFIGEFTSYEWDVQEAADIEDILNKSKEAIGRKVRVAAIFFKNEPRGAFWDKTVKVISNGRGFIVMEKALKMLGFKEENANTQFSSIWAKRTKLYYETTFYIPNHIFLCMHVVCGIPSLWR